MINKRKSLKDIINNNQSCISKTENAIAAIVNEEVHKESYERDSNKHYIEDEDIDSAEDSDCILFKFDDGKVYLAELFVDEDGWFYYADEEKLEDSYESYLYYSVDGIYGWRLSIDLY